MQDVLCGTIAIHCPMHTALRSLPQCLLAQYGRTGIYSALTLSHATDTDHKRRDIIALNHVPV